MPVNILQMPKVRDLHATSLKPADCIMLQNRSGRGNLSTDAGRYL